MKPTANPFEVRLAMSRRFPGWTQPFWTYLTALRPPGTERRLRWTQGHHLAVWLLVYVASAALGIASAGVLIKAALLGLPF